MSTNTYLSWLSSNTSSIYWHDSAVKAQQEAAYSNGASGMTTNPFLVGATLNSNKEFWAEQLKSIPKGLKGEQKIEALMQLVVGYYSDINMPLYQNGVVGKGYVCAQTNPLKTGDADHMVKQAKRLAKTAENVVIKLPATNAGIEAYEECVASGLNVAATVSFTVPQVLAVAEARERGKQRALVSGIAPGLGIAVMMIGRLDDYLRDVAHDQRSSVSESDITTAGIACMKRAYSIFNEKGYDTYLMPAGCRGANHITELAGAKMIMSISPKIADLLMDVTDLIEKINNPVDQKIIDRLLTLSEFRKAYEPDGMKREDFITFGATNRTTDQFINDGWNVIESFSY